MFTRIGSITFNAKNKSMQVMKGFMQIKQDKEKESTTEKQRHSRKM